MHFIQDTSQIDIGKVKKVYDGLISQRNQHTDVQLNTIELLSNGQVTHDVHISYPTQSILRKFRKYAQKYNYTILDSFCDEMYLIKSEFCSKLKLALCCVLPSYRPATSRFYVFTDEYRSVRVLVLENLNCGESHTLELKHLLYSFCDRHFPNPPLVEDLDNDQDLKTLEATSRYMYSKMLLEQNYSMGKKVAEFLSIVNGDIISTENIQWIQDVKNEIVQDMLEGFNCSRKELTQILCFCRTIVEEFLYSRIFPSEAEQAVVPQTIGKFPQTTKELIRLDGIVSPTLFDKQVFYVMVTFESECDPQKSTEGTVNASKFDALTTLMRELSLANLQTRMKIQEYYHQLNSQPEHFHEFEKAYKQSLLPK